MKLTVLDSVKMLEGMLLTVDDPSFSLQKGQVLRDEAGRLFNVSTIAMVHKPQGTYTYPLVTGPDTIGRILEIVT